MARRKKGRAVSGWLVLDKPTELGSTQAVGKVRWLFDAKKAGHAGTLDPLATGVLPIALGEATKTVPFVTDGEKSYRFTVRWGARTNTDDAEGEVIETSDERPSREAIEALLPRFTGAIEQVPPAFSAVKIDGERAYKRAREGESVEIAARTVEIDAFRVVSHAPDETVFEIDCGKGTYVRALARDLGRALGCQGHVTQLRRTFVEPFEESDAVPLSRLLEVEGDHDALDALLMTPRQAMTGFTELRLDENAAQRVRMGNAVVVRGRDAPLDEEDVCAIVKGKLVAIGDVAKGTFHPRRVLAG